MKTLALMLLLAATGCTTTRQFTPPTSLARIPQSLRQACAGTVDIPDRDLTAADVARLWAHDRKALGVCLRRHSALAKAVTILESGK